MLTAMPRYHAILTCGGLTEAEGKDAPAAIVEEFEHRPWHQNVICDWTDGLLRLEADNDYDSNWKALLDEFGDAVIACRQRRGTRGIALAGGL